MSDTYDGRRSEPPYPTEGEVDSRVAELMLLRNKYYAAWRRELARADRLKRDQRRIALDVIEAAAKECEQESTGDGITGTYQASWGRYLAGAVRALNVDEIIGRKP